jgi:hydrogenase maturation protease
MQPSVLVLGLGNPLRGDDGVGPRVVEELTSRGLQKSRAAFDVTTGGLELMQVLEGWKRVVVIDAAGVGQDPGQFVRFTPDQVRLARAADSFSLHHTGLSEVLALADALGRVLPEMVIFGVQPGEIGWREGLSPAVEAALPALADAVLEEIERGTPCPES